MSADPEIQATPSPEELVFPEQGSPLRQTFGPYIRRLREHAGFSLRAASAALIISFTRLQKIETGGRARVPEPDFFRRVASYYQQPLVAVLREAGVDPTPGADSALPPDPEQDFLRLLLEPSLCPQAFDEAWCQTFLPQHKRHWLSFALKLEALVARQGPTIGSILEAARQPGEAASSSQRSRPAHNDARCLGAQTFYWRYNAAFGPWLRQIRTDSDLNIRDAAGQLGLSFSMLQRLETGARVEPTIALLWRIVWLYGISLEELSAQAGLEVLSAGGLEGLDDEERAFTSLLLHPDLAPEGMASHWLETWPRRHQRQLIEFATRLEEEVLAGRLQLSSLLGHSH